MSYRRVDGERWNDGAIDKKGADCGGSSPRALERRGERQRMIQDTKKKKENNEIDERAKKRT